MTIRVVTRTSIIQFTYTHKPSDCVGRHCIIHNPKYPTGDRDLVWRADRGFFEDICDHGVGHPAPEEIEYWGIKYGDVAWAQEVHGCDGCCFPGGDNHVAPNAVL